jgi:hypothetical protein
MVVNPYFTEDSYKGQDIVHYGVRIPLNIPLEEILRKFSPNTRRMARRKLEVRDVTEEDLPRLRSMWFDPNDPTFPSDLSNHMGLIAKHGGVLWKPSGKNLFMHQLIADEEGKKLGVPTQLIWESVKKFHGKHHSLDIGVSYNPKRYAFFKNFAVETYPIILKKPFYVPVIRFSPFKGL